jgi:hypothetical protein
VLPLERRNGEVADVFFVGILQQHTYTLCGQNAELLDVTAGGKHTGRTVHHKLLPFMTMKIAVFF